MRIRLVWWAAGLAVLLTAHVATPYFNPQRPFERDTATRVLQQAARATDAVTRVGAAQDLSPKKGSPMNERDQLAACLRIMASVLRDLGLLGSVWSLILFYSGLQVPFTVFLYVAFLRALPRDFEDAALIDGCTPLQGFWYVVFPMLKPVTVTALVLNAVAVWNDFFTPLLYLSGSTQQTMPVAIAGFVATARSHAPPSVAGQRYRGPIGGSGTFAAGARRPARVSLSRASHPGMRKHQAKRTWARPPLPPPPRHARTVHDKHPRRPPPRPRAAKPMPHPRLRRYNAPAPAARYPARPVCLIKGYSAGAT